jgi:hypothetical protein
MKRKQTADGARPKRKAKPTKTPPREAPQKAADRPFNNPFADLLKP